jgi:hypothetical protein
MITHIASLRGSFNFFCIYKRYFQVCGLSSHQSCTFVVFISSSVLTCREVKSVTGRGKGIPHALRAFARVLCASTPQGLCTFYEPSISSKCVYLRPRIPNLEGRTHPTTRLLQYSLDSLNNVMDTYRGLMWQP